MKRLRHTDLIILPASAAALAALVIAAGWFGGGRSRPSQAAKPTSRPGQARPAEKPRTPADAVPLGSITKSHVDRARASSAIPPAVSLGGRAAKANAAQIRLGTAGTRPAASPLEPVGTASIGRVTEGEFQRRFVMSLCWDFNGNLWVGCEDTGIWRFDPNANEGKRWTRFTMKDGLGDDNGYALACDRQGRIWAGHLNHGVSIYNGTEWRNYDVVAGLSNPDTLSGPIGERIFAIKVSPRDGDVWISTNCGLARYREASGVWTYYTHADGLPPDNIVAIAFNQRGTLYAATACNGIAVADLADDYGTWRVTRGPDEPPLSLAGDGLPTSLINDVVVAKDQTVYAATDAGLAWSTDGGHQWQFMRGADWLEKAQQRYAAREGMQAPPRAVETSRRPPREDYCTCLLQGTEPGSVWVGHRRYGYELISRAQVRATPPESESAAYVTTLLMTPEGTPIMGAYGSGIAGLSNAKRASHRQALRAPFPEAAHEPSSQTAARGTPRSLSQEPASTGVQALEDDWSTQGDWLGRYGKYWACLAAMRAPNDLVWGTGEHPVPYNACIDPRDTPNDSLRYWMHWLYTTDRRSLEMPAIYLHSRVLRGLTTWERNRRQSEWDDHGERYPLSRQGPDVYLTVEVPAGQFVLALYDFNKDGHSLLTRLRDYPVSVRRHPSGRAFNDVSGFDGEPELARGRICNFNGGVYKRFYVAGPVTLDVRLSRNHSVNTILAGVMLDRIAPPIPEPYCLSGPQAPAPAQRSIPTSLAGRAPAHPDRDRPLPRVGSAQRGDFSPRTLERREYMDIVRRVADAKRFHEGTRDRDAPEASEFEDACYRSWLFNLWETSVRARRGVPPRDIETRLRWDGATNMSPGIGYRYVAAVLRNPDAGADKESGAGAR